MIMIINRIYKFRDIESPVFGPSLIMMDNETAHDNKMPWRQRSLNISPHELEHVLGCVLCKSPGLVWTYWRVAPGPVTEAHVTTAAAAGADTESTRY